MSTTTEEVSTIKAKKRAGKSRSLVLDQGLADRLVAEARETGGIGSLTGPDGVLSQVVAQILETALSVELDDHLGYDRHGRRPAGSVNARNGTTAKMGSPDACVGG